MTVKGYLLLTIACFGAFAWFATNGHGYLAGIVGIVWYLAISITTGGFGKGKAKGPVDDVSTQSYEDLGYKFKPGGEIDFDGMH